ncbi:MAG: nicotinate phosphoribosyltransferase [Armatimonadetes bacterium]|nr:nicotinate phosphoribosyltransferase [Armatimonadota bacterium]
MSRVTSGIDPCGSVLLTDLYQLTMLQAYHDEGLAETAVFDLFVRKLPERRNFLLAAGLEQALDYLEALRFTPEELAYLERTGLFGAEFLAYLREFRFTGDVSAMPEGTVFFPDEPVLRVSGPLPEAQLIESRLINLMNFQTMIASKAARMALAGEGRRLVDFGFRRAHGAEAGLMAARAAAVAGFEGTATVIAGATYGLPISGTMAHAYVLAHDREEEAFLRFARSMPGNAVFLIDTYDTVEGTRKVVGIAPQLKREGIPIRAVRLDSGDLAELSKQVRRVLDAGGLQDVKILASGDLDEYEIKRLRDAGAPIDAYGVGTRLVTSPDTPYLSMVYKLQEYAGRPRRKRSAGKETWPGRKQVYRKMEAGRMEGDALTLADDPNPDGAPLLQPVMENGKRLAAAPPLEEIRRHAAEELSRLPEALRSLETAPAYPVTISPRLRQLADEADKSSRQ